jgi:hypothetical protein
MTISNDYEDAITALEALQVECLAAADAITAPQQDDGSSLKKNTLLKAADNANAAIISLRGPGSTNAGMSDRTRTKLSELGL